MESHVMIKFLPTTLNQLFRVLTSATQEDVAVNVTRQVSLKPSFTQQTALKSFHVSYDKQLAKKFYLDVCVHKKPVESCF